MPITAPIFEAAQFIPTSGPLGYFPLDTSETAGNITSYAYPVRNVKRYGAVGDGSNDDSVAIQRAVTAAIAAGGGTIRFPRPSVEYKITTAINWGTGTNLVFQGERGTVIRATTATQRAFTSGGACSNITFDRLKIVGTFALGIVGAAVTGLKVFDCDISGASSADATAGGWCGGLFLDNCSDVRIERFKGSGNGVPGAANPNGFDIQFGGNGVGACSRIMVRDCDCTSTDALLNIGGFDMSETFIVNNRVSGARTWSDLSHGGYGIMLYQSTAAPFALHNNTVSGNRVRDTQGTGIYFQAVYKGVCSFNDLENTCTTQSDAALAVAAISIASCSMVATLSNTSTKTGVGHIVVSDATGTNYGNTVVGNTMDGAGTRPSIYLRGAVNRLEIGANVITNCLSGGIGNIDNGVPVPAMSHLNIHDNVITGAAVFGAGTVTIVGGAATFTVAQLTALVNTDKIRAGGLVYTLSAFNGAGTTATATGIGVGTVTSAAGVTSFSETQGGVLVNGSVIKVGATSYTISAFDANFLNCTLSGAPT